MRLGKRRDSFVLITPVKTKEDDFEVLPLADIDSQNSHKSMEDIVTLNSSIGSSVSSLSNSITGSVFTAMQVFLMIPVIFAPKI